MRHAISVGWSIGAAHISVLLHDWSTTWNNCRINYNSKFSASNLTLSYAKSPPVDSWLHSKLTEISQRERLLSPFRNQSFFTIVILYANNLCSKLATHYAEIGLFMTLEKWRTLSPPESSSSANASCRVPFAWSPHANFKIDISQP